MRERTTKAGPLLQTLPKLATRAAAHWRTGANVESAYRHQPTWLECPGLVRLVGY